MTNFENSGLRLPDDRPDLTDNERAWMSFLRELHDDPVRAPTLRAIQVLRRALWGQEDPDSQKP